MFRKQRLPSVSASTALCNTRLSCVLNMLTDPQRSTTELKHSGRPHLFITLCHVPRCCTLPLVCATGHHPVTMGDGACVNSHLHTPSCVQPSTHTLLELSSNNILSNTHSCSAELPQVCCDAWAVMAAWSVVKLRQKACACYVIMTGRHL